MEIVKGGRVGQERRRGKGDGFKEVEAEKNIKGEDQLVRKGDLSEFRRKYGCKNRKN